MLVYSWLVGLKDVRAKYNIRIISFQLNSTGRQYFQQLIGKLNLADFPFVHLSINILETFPCLIYLSNTWNCLFFQDWGAMRQNYINRIYSYQRSFDRTMIAKNQIKSFFGYFSSSFHQTSQFYQIDKIPSKINLFDFVKTF